MANTTFKEVYDAFEATFADKIEVQKTLERQWLKMSVAKWNVELAIDNLLEINEEAEEFLSAIDQYTINLLGAMMKEYYQSREFSRANKIASIVGKDISVNGSMVMSKYAKEDLDNAKENVKEMIAKATPIVSD